nr:proline-rich protein 36-like [Aegilops tauschii subsp. strangulata]
MCPAFSLSRRSPSSPLAPRIAYSTPAAPWPRHPSLQLAHEPRRCALPRPPAPRPSHRSSLLLPLHMPPPPLLSAAPPPLLPVAASLPLAPHLCRSRPASGRALLPPAHRVPFPASARAARCSRFGCAARARPRSHPSAHVPRLVVVAPLTVVPARAPHRLLHAGRPVASPPLAAARTRTPPMRLTSPTCAAAFPPLVAAPAAAHAATPPLLPVAASLPLAPHRSPFGRNPHARDPAPVARYGPCATDTRGSPPGAVKKKDL